jgi:hypothetical protein
MPGNETDEYKRKLEETKEAKNKVLQELDAKAKRERDEANEELRAAKAARNDASSQEASKLWDGEHGVGAKLEQMSREGAKGYDNFKAAMGAIVELSLEMAYAINASVRPGETLVDVASSAASLVVNPVGSVVGGLGHAIFKPSQAAEDVSNSLAGFGRKLGFGKGENLVLSNEMASTSSCDARGKLTFQSTKDLLPESAPPELVAKMDELNKAMNKAFLASHGYHEAGPDQFVKKVAGRYQPLDSATFESLKSNPKTGLDAFASKQQNITLSGKPIEPENESQFQLRR